jgi:hypothetical protein
MFVGYGGVIKIEILAGMGDELQLLVNTVKCKRVYGDVVD